MRFFACDACVDENCRIEHLVCVARSVLENKEIDFMAIERGGNTAMRMKRSLSSRNINAIEMKMQVTTVYM